MRGTLGLLSQLSLAHLRRHPTRVLLTLIGIALGVGAVTAVLALSRSIVSTFQTTVIRGAGAAQLQVSNGTAGLDRELADTLKAAPGVIATGATVQHHVLVPAAGTRLTILGVELGRDEAYREVQTGPDVADIPDIITFIANTDSIAVSDALARAQGWKRGDVIEVVGSHGPQRLTLRGTLKPKGTLDAYGGAVAVMDLDAAQLRFGEPNRVHWVDVVLAEDADVDAIRGAIERVLAGRGTVDAPIARGQRIESMVSLLRVLLTGTSLLAMLVGIFLIQHTLSTSYRQRHADFIRLRALGLSRWRLVTYLIGEATLLGLAASIVGLAGGIGVWRLITDEFSTTFSSLFLPLPPPQFALTLIEACAALALGTLAVVVGALTLVVSTLRLRPFAISAAAGGPTARNVARAAAVGGALIAVSFLVAPLARGAGFVSQIAVIGIMGGALFLGTAVLVPATLSAAGPLWSDRSLQVWRVLSRWVVHQVWRQRVHTATTIGSLAAGVALAIAFTVLLGSYRTAFREWFAQTFVTGDVILNAGPTISMLGAQTIDPELGGAIAKLPDVADVLRWRFLEVEYAGRPIVLQAMSDELLDRIYPAAAQDGSVIISDTFAERFGLTVGDMLVLPAPVREFRAKVGAVVPDYVLHLGSVKIGWRTFVEHFGDERVSLYGANARAGVTPAQLKTEIDALVGGRYDVAVLTATDVRALVENLVDQSIALTYGLQIIAALIAVAAMVNATLVSIIDREREMRTWRALGLLRGRLVRMLVGEATVVGLLGSALGVGAGALLGYSLTTEIARAAAGYRLAVTWPVSAFIGAPVVSTLAAAAAAAVVAMRWTRGRPFADAPERPAEASL